MSDMRDIYNEEKTEDTDWYVSVRFWQIVLCSILTVILCASFYTDESESLKSGYKYLTCFSTIQEFSDAVESIKQFVSGFGNAEI